MGTPKVSIGMPVYNGERYLRTAIDSILEQDYTDFELIVCDNASTDSTSKICSWYAERDSRVRYLRNQTNLGASANYTRVFDSARGEFFKWAAHDDVNLPGFLRRCVEVLNGAPSTVVLVAPRTEIIDESGLRVPSKVESLETRRTVPHQRVAHVLHEVQWATAQFGLFRSEALRKTRLIDAFPASDYVLLLEIAILGEIWEIPEILFQRRFHEEVSTKANRTQSELLNWFDSSKQVKIQGRRGLKAELEPRTKLAVEYLKSIARMPMSLKERLLCSFLALWFWSFRELQRLWPEYTARVRNKLTDQFQKRRNFQLSR
jgi:glycosyltransferase involved in cell wall biosynthesis